MEADRHWVSVWAGPAQGPFPTGNTLLQPDQSLAFPEPVRGARDQTFRLMVRPSLWGSHLRLRLSNVFGKRPVVFAETFVGLRLGGGALVPDTNLPVAFDGQAGVEIEPGGDRWSDTVDLAPFAAFTLEGRDLAISLAVASESGPVTWHAKALSTSYLTPPGSRSRAGEPGEEGFPLTASSWFFVDALDMAMPRDAFALVALGDSITEGTGSTFGGFDRWTDILIRMLRGRGIGHVAVVNSGIGGNQIAGPARYDADHPFPGGPSGLSRLQRDVLDLSAVRVVVWLQGINDFSRNGGRSFPEVRDAMIEGVGRMRHGHADRRIVGVTLPPTLGSTNPVHGFPEQDAARRALNDLIRTSGLFDVVADFESAAVDPASGRLRREFCLSSVEGPGDYVHINRAGNMRLAELLVDLVEWSR